jgi:integrase/recombinase XerD
VALDILRVNISAMLSNRAHTRIRNRALLYIGYKAGLRLSEALALYPKDVETDKDVIRVLHGKEDKARILGLPMNASITLDRWLDKRKKLKLSNKSPTFCTLDGKPMSDAYVRALMKRLQERGGIDKRVHFMIQKKVYEFSLAEYCAKYRFPGLFF